MTSKNIRSTLHVFVLLAFCLYLVLPFAASYAQTPAKDSVLQVQGKVLLCTARGLEWVSLSALAEQPQHTPQRKYQCALCYINSHPAYDAVILANDSFTFAPDFTDAVPTCYFEIVPEASDRLLVAASRAPPTFSLV